MNKRIIILILTIVLILVVTKAHKQIIPSTFYDVVGDKFVLVDSQGNLRSSDQASITATDKIQIAGNLDVKNNANITNNVSGKSIIGDGTVPKGLISAFYGSEIPAGWAICDGNNGTPDLRGRFILALNPSQAPATDRLTNKAGDKGGVERVTLSEAEMPRHSHEAPAGIYASSYPDAIGVGYAAIWKGSTWNGIPGLNSNSNISVKGGNQPHENMPPFYVLAYIMKL